MSSAQSPQTDNHARCITFASSSTVMRYARRVGDDFTKGSTRGLGLAIAITSAAFFPHCEQRIRSASSLSVIFQPTRRASACG